MKLEDIGFYTLSDDRAKQTSHTSRLWRCEILVTNSCNFSCQYCRSVGPKGHMSWEQAKTVFDVWIKEKLKNVRISGGEPTLWPHLEKATAYLNGAGVERIAISTNGSASTELYNRILMAGASDFSISFDACCSEDCKAMSGGRDAWKRITNNIKFLSSKTYVTAGIVLTTKNEAKVCEIVQIAQELGVSDVRVIPAAQHSKALNNLPIGSMPILEYRRKNISEGVRGLRKKDSKTCYLVLDDMAVIGNKHYPCIIYAREGGQAIGNVDNNMRLDRKKWSEKHNCKSDKICAGNCLDVCRDYNNKVGELKN